MRDMSPEELLELIQGGASVSRKDEPALVQALKDIVVQMTAVAEVQRAAAEAQKEAARIQAEGLERAVENIAAAVQNGAVDAERIAAIVTEAVKPQAKPGWYFSIDRNQYGDISGVAAEPKTRRMN